MASRSPGLIRFWTLLIAGACCLPAQSKRQEDLAAGKILVTTRGTRDPLFAESVVLLVRYNETDALGLMVNRRTKLPISRALRELKRAEGNSSPVFVGGPVELDTLFALARAPHRPDGATEVSGHIYLIAARPALEKALGSASNPSEMRIYLGYCGWGPHQLENEVRQGGWFIFNRSEDLAFDPEPPTLWTRLIDKAEAQMARLGFVMPGTGW